MSMRCAMPTPVYGELSDNDALAIATYLLTVKPIKHEVPRTVYIYHCQRITGLLSHVAEPASTGKVAYGKYLVTFGHCAVPHPRG
jgi:hypothetical protein